MNPGLTDAKIQARIEDLFFLDHCGVGLEEMARRIGITKDALRLFCKSHKVSALYVRAKHRGHICTDRCPRELPPRPEPQEVSS